MPTPEQGSGGPGRTVYFALGGAVLLTFAGGAAFYAASRQAGGGTASGAYEVSVSATACEPNEITVPGGRRSFEIVNTSDRPIEWEILDGVMVVAERENITPGLRQTVSAQLAPGDYEITCGLLSNPRGTLHVTQSEEASAAASEIGLRQFLGPLSEYKVYLLQQGTVAASATEDLAAAIEAGDLEKAQSLWGEARLPYARVEPLAWRFSDLRAKIDPVAAYLEKREDDAGFTGFHRIEYGLFEQQSTEGLAQPARQLADDMATLKDRLGAQELDPALLLSLPGDLARHLAESRIPAGEDSYAQQDLAEIEGNFEGIAKLTGLLQEVVRPVAPELDEEIDGKLAAIRDELAGQRGDVGYPPYGEVDEAKRESLATAFASLADSLDRLQTKIGTG